MNFVLVGIYMQSRPQNTGTWMAAPCPPCHPCYCPTIFIF